MNRIRCGSCCTAGHAELAIEWAATSSNSRERIWSDCSSTCPIAIWLIFPNGLRHLMMEQIVAAVRSSGEVPPFVAELKAINCHHNYVARESHYGQNILVTRKGAVRAREGDMGIIPGSMGA